MYLKTDKFWWAKLLNFISSILLLFLFNFFLVSSVFFFSFLFFVCLFETEPCSLSWLQTISNKGWLWMPASTSQVLGLQTYTLTPSFLLVVIGLGHANTRIAPFIHSQESASFRLSSCSQYFITWKVMVYSPFVCIMRCVCIYRMHS